MILKMKNKKKKVKEIVYPASWNFKIYKYKAHSNRNLPFSFSTSFIPKASVLIFLQTKQPFFSVLSHRKTRQVSLSLSPCVETMDVKYFMNFSVSDSV